MELVNGTTASPVSCGISSPTGFGRMTSGVQPSRSLIGPWPRRLNASEGCCGAHSHWSFRRTQRPHSGCSSSHLTRFLMQVRQPRGANLHQSGVGVRSCTRGLTVFRPLPALDTTTPGDGRFHLQCTVWDGLTSQEWIVGMKGINGSTLITALEVLTLVD